MSGGGYLEADVTYTIAAFECRNEVVHDSCQIMPNADDNKRQGWPDIQHVSRTAVACTEKPQIQAMW